jgi:hypothetical protein
MVMRKLSLENQAAILVLRDRLLTIIQIFEDAEDFPVGGLFRKKRGICRGQRQLAWLAAHG